MLKRKKIYNKSINIIAIYFILFSLIVSCDFIPGDAEEKIKQLKQEKNELKEKNKDLKEKNKKLKAELEKRESNIKSMFN